jgi:hypothetical protein
MIRNRLGFEMDGIINSLENCDMTEQEILDMKSKMKAMDKKLKEKNKPKTITVSAQTHNTIKNYCNVMNYNIGEWTTSVLLEKINDDKCIDVVDDSDELREEQIEEINERYLSERWGNLYKTSKIVMNKNFKFVGYSSLDALPIYEVKSLTDNIKEILVSSDIKIDLINKRQISPGIYHNLDLEIEII